MAQAKPRSSRTERGRTAPQRSGVWLFLVIITVVAAFVFGVWYIFGRVQEPVEAAHDHGAGTEAANHHHGDTEILHIHGLGFSGDGQRLFVPAHTGFQVYAHGGWFTPNVPPHDYMGYVATDDGFYSSGHPAPNSDLVNPLGLGRICKPWRVPCSIAPYVSRRFNERTMGAA
jgi:hypothetical protein